MREPTPAAQRTVTRTLLVLASAGMLFLLGACGPAGSSGVVGTVAMIPGYQGGQGAAVPQSLVYPGSTQVVNVTLGETSSTAMYIHMSQNAVPAGKVSFVITNEGKEDHEMVVLQTKVAADALPIVTFDGEPNRINEDAKNVKNVGETGDPPMAPGTTKVLTIDLASGHYAVVCNLQGHYAMGMHQDLWVTPPGSVPVTVGLGETSSTAMYIHMSQNAVPAGKVSFVITNEGKEDHEMVVLQTKVAADALPIVTFDGEPNRINEDAKNVKNVGETGDPPMAPGTTKVLTIDLASGHYAVVCNLQGHYAMGMHQDLWVTPPGSVPVTVGLGETSSTAMYIHMSQNAVPAGKVSFVITNEGKEDHEMVVLQTKVAADALPIVTFDGEPNRINEDAKNVKNVGETGDPPMAPGTTKVLTIDLASGHYAVVCNLQGHYAMGMHQDLWVTPPGSVPVTVGLGETSSTAMYIHMSQNAVPAGKVSFVITNEGKEDHEMVVLQTKVAADALPIVTFDGEPNRINEDAKNVKNVGETGDPPMAPGTTKVLTIDLASGHYAVVCNLQGHYAMGMHQDLWVTPPLSLTSA